MRHWSIRAKLTLYYALALALIILAFSTGIYYLVRADLLRQMDAQLNHDMATVVGETRGDPEEVPEVTEEGLVGLFAMRSGGREVAASPAWRRAGLSSAKPIGNDMVRSPKGRVYYTRHSHVSAEHHRRHYETEIVVARDGDSLRRTLTALGLILLVGLACALGLAAAGGYMLAGRVLAPVGAMAAKAQSITADKLSERLPVHNPNDELGTLSAAFNNALTRLEDSFDRLRRFTSDASHELRTPLAAMRSVGEVAMRDGVDDASRREAISSMLEEVERLTLLVDSLLTLTRADTGATALSFAPTDVSALANDAVESLRVLADEKSIELTAETAGGVNARADAAILKQAIVNLLDNAIKYTPEHGRVAISVAEEKGNCIVEVTDTGPGIPREDRERVFERFYRGDKSRARETGGVGLGLAIAKWAVEANGGAIELIERTGRGCAFRITLPGMQAGSHGIGKGGGADSDS